MTDTSMVKPPQHEGHDSPLWIVILLSSLAIFATLWVVMSMLFGKQGMQVGEYKMWLKILGVIITLGIFSILYKENPFFRFLEHIYIGLAAGYTLVLIWVEYIQPKWIDVLLPTKIDGGHWMIIFTLLLGLLFYTVYFPKLTWMNRLIMGMVMGYYAGFAFQMIIGNLGPQLIASFRSPVTTYAPVNEPAGLNNFQLGNLDIWLHPWTLISLVVLLCVMTYFFFSVEQRRPWIRKPAIAGRYFIMITLGAIFGTTVMGRFSLLIARLEFLQTAFQSFGAAIYIVIANIFHLH